MLKDDVLIGVIAIYRQEVRPFTDKQIELVKSFASQAVIAIENTRLLNELRQRTDDLSEALEQQTATSEVLRVISSSPGELEPVFHSMLENAVRVCDAKFGFLMRFDGKAFHRVEEVGTPPGLAEFLKTRGAFQPLPGSLLERVMQTHQVCDAADVVAEAIPSIAGRLGGTRSVVCVPMLKEGVLAGAITIYRQEVRPFTDKHIALVENFASQAVIAIENTRLLNELKQSLEQQTATADVLRVISSSPGDLKPVFDAILENATRICEAKFGALWLTQGNGVFEAVALHDVLPEHVLAWPKRLVQPNPKTALGRVAMTKQVAHIADLAKEHGYIERDPLAVSFVEIAGVRTVLGVPMLKDDALIGAFFIYRQEVRPFTDKQIELVQNFAAQAVIAIENTRLLNELRESLDRQTATADILRVIAGTPEDSKRALDTIAETASRMFDTANLTLSRNTASSCCRALPHQESEIKRSKFSLSQTSSALSLFQF